MMERLTDRTGNGQVYLIEGPEEDMYGYYTGKGLKQIEKVIARLAAYEDSGLSPEEVQELAKAKAEGRLVVLPCKVGDTVYVNSGCLFHHDDAPFTLCKVVVIKTTKREVTMHLRPLCESAAGTRYHRWFGISSIGKTVFLTREAAEKALGGAEDAGNID